MGYLVSPSSDPMRPPTGGLLFKRVRLGTIATFSHCTCAIRRDLGGRFMLLVRYFVFTGGLVLGLLFLCNWYFPTPAPVVAQNDIDRSIIRIHSRHRWPEAIRIDTNTPFVSTKPLAGDTAAADTASASDSLATARQAAPVSHADARLSASSHRAPERMQRVAKPRPASRNSAQRFASYRVAEPPGGLPSW